MDKGMLVGVTPSGDKISGQIRVPESVMPETPNPWFSVEMYGKKWKGQSLVPPVAMEDGSLLYSVEMEPVCRRRAC